jgi:hypothetical protein
MQLAIHKSIGSAVVRKEGISIGMIVDVHRWYASLLQTAQRQGKRRDYNVSLRDLTLFLLGFFGLRRASELMWNPDLNMGLRIQDVSFDEGVAIRLFIRRHKADPFARGNEVVLPFFSQSGVPLGALLQQLLTALQENGITSLDDPVFCNTDVSGAFIRPRAGVAVDLR